MTNLGVLTLGLYAGDRRLSMEPLRKAVVRLQATAEVQIPARLERDYVLPSGSEFQTKRSKAIAVASPPPIHSAATPRDSPCRSNAAKRVTMILAPDAPMG